MPMTIPVEWILGVLIGLGGIIATLAKLIWSIVQSRLAAQDNMIASQTSTITKLQDDIERLSKGCGIGTCIWKNR
jgi:hypothetical protein